MKLKPLKIKFNHYTIPLSRIPKRMFSENTLGLNDFMSGSNRRETLKGWQYKKFAASSAPKKKGRHTGRKMIGEV